MTSEGLGEKFECDSVDRFAGKFPLVSMGGQAEGRAKGLACADPGARTPKISLLLLPQLLFSQKELS